MDEIDLSQHFLGKELRYPLLVNALTGGTDQARRINQALAYISRKHGLAMALGSQTIALEDQGLRETFSIVREINPGGLLMANLAASASLEKVLSAVEMISADAVQLHFNVPQELAMYEGDRNFKGVLKNIENIACHCPVPLIAKEVGFGFSREAVKMLFDSGVKIFDNGGKGGTNFIVIEDQRDGNFNHELYDWGIPTAISLAEIISLKLPIGVIASGGIRTATDAAKAIAMGAECVGMAAPFLKILLDGGIEELDKMVSSFLYRLRAVFLMTASRNIKEMQKQPLIIVKETAEWLRAREIDPHFCSKRI
jgi:isopentenyl-diphosphate delta-isomerase